MGREDRNAVCHQGGSGLGPVGAFGPGIHQRGNGDPSPQQVQRDVVALVVGGGDDGGVSRLYAVEPHQTLGSGCQHDAGQVVALEDQRDLIRAGGHYDSLRSKLHQVLVAEDAKEVALVETEGRGIG